MLESVTPLRTTVDSAVREMIDDDADENSIGDYIEDDVNSFQAETDAERIAYAHNLEYLVIRKLRMTPRERTEDCWNQEAEATFIGRTITHAEYMSPQVADEHGWHSRPLVLWLDDGNTVYAMQDDEGNDGGALFTLTECGRGSYIFPVI